MIRLTMRSRLLTVGLAGVLAVGLVGMAGVAVADRGEGGPRAEQRDSRHLQRPAIVGLAQLVKASGLDPEVVRSGFANGQTLGEIFADNGIDGEAVVREVLQNFEARLNEAVANGKLTQDQADRLLAAATESLPKLLDAEPPSGGPRPRHPIMRNQLQSAAESIGVTTQELLAELRNGNSIAEVAEAHGVDPQTVIDDMVAAANANIDRLVEAGKLTPEQAAIAKARAAEAIAKLVHGRD